jgi:cysteine-rich repeat protein
MVTIYTCGASTFAVGSSNTPATCGDSSVDAQETCDDGNNVSGDGCQGNE